MKRMIILAVAGFALVFATAIASRNYLVLRVHEESMRPAVCSGDFVLVRISDTDAVNPTNLIGEMVVFANQDRSLALKRVYGVAGDVIRFSRTHIAAPQLNSEQLRTCTVPFKSRSYRSTLVKPEEIFLGGDNLRFSNDSRAFGPAPIYSLVGVVKLRVTTRLSDCGCS